MRRIFLGTGIIFAVALLLFLFPRIPGDFLRLAETTFFPHKEVVAEIPLGREASSEVVPPAEAQPPNFDRAVPYPTLLISEVMAGSSANAQDEFVELYNPSNSAVPLTDWNIKKRSAAGNESSFISASRLKDKTIPPHRYFLIAHDGGYANTIATPDAFWPKSYSLSSGSGALVLYNPAGEQSDKIVWSSIPKDRSLVRASWEPGAALVLLPVPTPQSSGGSSN